MHTSQSDQSRRHHNSANYVAALFENDDTFGKAVQALHRIGIVRATLVAAARSAKRMTALAERYGVDWTDSAIRENGMLAEFARITGREEQPAASLQEELVERGVDADRARTFDERLGGSNVLLMVPGANNAAALEILARAGADLGFKNGAGLVKTIPLRSETIEVVKRIVVDAEVRVRTDVIVERKTFEIELTREELVIERTDRLIDGSPLEVIRIPLKHDEAIIDKQTIVTSEVLVRTEFYVDHSVVTEELRHEELVVADPRQTTS
ncbi:MAG: YsnF/AvaK domain-containing protein [Candidatus Eremiobacteraeota bacterium]|nr:YsnF/AvaK domain-containing protein [Candidatus Eremiobacteraeota bacterium]